MDIEYPPPCSIFCALLPVIPSCRDKLLIIAGLQTVHYLGPDFKISFILQSEEELIIQY